MRIETDHQALRSDPDAGAIQPVHLTDQDSGIENDAVSNHANLAGMENSGWNKVEDVFRTIYYQSVSGVVSALKPDHDVRSFRKEIDHFAFAFVTPLRADNHYICHDSLFLSSRSIYPKIQAQTYPGVFT
jgi:hypothetical protein